MRRVIALLAGLGLLALVLAALASAQDTVFSVEVKDRRGETHGPLDIVRVALGPTPDDVLVGQVTMAGRWSADELRAPAGAQGSLCFELYVRRTAGEDPPDYLACATPAATGDAFVGRVLRNRADGLPRTIADAEVRRLSRRTLELRFAAQAIGSPARVAYEVETATYGRRCPRPQGCLDASPEIRPARLRLG